MRNHDPAAFAQYARLGAYVLPAGMEADARELEPRVMQLLPTFGAIAIGIDSIVDANTETGDDGLPTVPVRFAYFEKLRRVGPAIQRMNDGVAYRVTAYYDDDKDPKIREHGTGISATYAVQVLPCGEVVALRMLKDQRQIIRHRRGRYRGYTSTVVHQRWGLPETNSKRDPATTIKFLFITAVNFWATAAEASMIRVTATKEGLTMPFVVNVTDTRHIFSDRDSVLDEMGRTKRIFHVVRAHTRSSGQAVRLHFRGLRNFAWNGYQIMITVPGRDHLAVNEFNVGAEVYGDDEVAPDGLIPVTEAADVLADWIGAPPGPNVMVR